MVQSLLEMWIDKVISVLPYNLEFGVVYTVATVARKS
jgi:hypothetical protein